MGICGIYNLQFTIYKVKVPRAAGSPNSGASPHGEAAQSPGRKPWVGRNKLFEPRRREGWHNAHASIYYIALCHPTIRWGSNLFSPFPTVPPLTRLHRGLLYAARTCAGSKSGSPAARGISTLYIVHCTLYFHKSPFVELRGLVGKWS